MLPPILEIYVLWHPDDRAGSEAANQIFEHFSRTIFSGLIGGAIEVFVRSEGWNGHGDSPRPIPFPADPPPNEIPAAQISVVVPIIGNELAIAVEVGSAPGMAIWKIWRPCRNRCRNGSASFHWWSMWAQ